ncbi:MAG: SDR family NAD(P)-dependent oxidoreductase [Spirochaetales bacterium]|nr:SDR family NAD(P)-dependent oxidoreductase [Spirochaetales bacterium]
MRAKKNTYAVITGATSGIGAEFARQLAGQGYNLIISGRRKEVIEKVARDIRETYKTEVTVVIADFLKQPDITEFIRVVKKTGNIEFLINNAGFGHAEEFFEDTYPHQKTMIDVHVNATTEITHAVVPELRKNGKGFIINVSSMAPMLSSPSSPLYSATKGYINIFSEALFMLLKPDHIKVQALCPGFTRTDFHEKIGMTREQCKNVGIIRWMRPEKVVRISLKSIGKNKVIIVPGFLNKLILAFISILKSLPGGIYYSISSRIYESVTNKILVENKE